MKFGRYKCFEGTCRIIIRVGTNLRGVTYQKTLILILCLPPRETRFPNVSYNCLCHLPSWTARVRDLTVLVLRPRLESLHALFAATYSRRRYIRLNKNLHNITHSTHMWLTDWPFDGSWRQGTVCLKASFFYLLKKFCFDGTQLFITVFTKSCDWIPALF